MTSQEVTTLFGSIDASAAAQEEEIAAKDNGLGQIRGQRYGGIPPSEDRLELDTTIGKW